MWMLETRGGSTELPVHGYFEHQQSGGFGPGRQNRSPQEVVRHDPGPDHDHKPQRRGCGCTAVPVVALTIATAPRTGLRERTSRLSIAKSIEFLPEEE